MSEKNDIDIMQHAWQRWWDYEGSAMRPHPSEDTEQFAGRITKIAWLNGEYKRLAEIERLRAELAAMRQQRDEARRDACAFEGIIKFNLQHPKGIISTEATLRLANEIAVERGWDCFAQKEGGGA